MTNWYKYSLTEVDFAKRNLLNDRVRYLRSVRNELFNLAKIIFQTASTAKQSNYNILTHKKMSSYPSLRDILISADAVALDSPWRFASYCHEAINIINKKLFELDEDRDDLIRNKKNKVEKGWV